MESSEFVDTGAMTLKEAGDVLSVILNWRDNNAPTDSEVDYLSAIDEGMEIFMANAAFSALLKAE